MRELDLESLRSHAGELGPAGASPLGSAAAVDGAPRPALAKLLGGRPAEPFFAATWEREPALHRGGYRDAAELLTPDQLEALVIAAATESPSRLSIVDKIARPVTANGDEAAAVAAVFRAYHAGASLLLTELQQRWRPITRLCRALEGELIGLGVRIAQRIGANAYLTPARSQGFDLHYDDHCVFIVQLAGTKQWQVHAPRVELPVDRCTAPIPADQLDPPILEAELAAGDVLYIPRGFPHAARTGGDSSLHLTLSLHTLTWLAVIHDALRGHVELRRSIPRSLGDRGAQGQFDELRAALALGDLDDRIERKVAEAVARLVPVPNGRLRAIDGVRDGAIGPTTRVTRVDGAPCVVHRDGDHVVMRIPGATLRLPAVMEPAFAFIAQRAAFSPAELPRGRAVFDAIELVGILVRDGLLAIAPARDDEAS